MNQTGKCIIFSAPSGAGKTTIVHALLNANIGLEFSVSACSRDPRPNEVNGTDYHFLGLEGFKQKIERQDFIEWEEVYTNNFYGTLKSEIERIWSHNKTVIFEGIVEGKIIEEKMPLTKIRNWKSVAENVCGKSNRKNSQVFFES